ncbi:FG-GAP-like repeat-containing protein [Streptomyces sp. HNM0663]|uniref:FG-GAP-like repeat-containing protein n=1 Tax=Streptomyces chengmaiensis TaxID=3040919 RepID=A0ABT6HWF0_9ACTN|nr:FG-GAP-like repeat-containing protein [Streptomyces chengmaiensis]MDH2393036.1 FG-GAP-like repeat-containing protein [Streptomyces chengmaiensis]
MSSNRPRKAITGGLMATAVAAPFAIAAPAHAVVGDAVEQGAYAFTAHLAVDDTDRACSGVLVDHQWVLSAASCFAETPGKAVPAGKPSAKTVATVGRADLSASGGHTSEIVELVPSPDRELVMARLAKPADGLTPIDLATDAPAAGDSLKVAGFGRTKTTWVPERLHAGTFTVDSVTDTAVNISAEDGAGAVCKGDAGGPAFRERSGVFELVAVNSRSWQGGCFGETETRTGAAESRVDTAAGWIQRIRLASLHQNVTDLVTSADFNGDGRPDVAAILKDGNLHAFYTAANGKLQYGRELWKHDGSWRHKLKIVGGDFNGDGRADIAAVNGDGNLHLYPGTSGGRLGSPLKMWKDDSWRNFLNVTRYRGVGWERDGLIAISPSGGLYAYPSAANGVLSGKRHEMWHDKTWNKKHISSGDFNGDGRDDVIAVAQSGGLHLYKGNAKGKLDSGASMWHDESWGGFRVIMGGDFNGDGKGDVAAINSSGGLYLYPGDGKGKLGSRTAMWPAKS